MISLFILVSMLGFAEGENEGSAIREVPIIENQGAQTEKYRSCFKWWWRKSNS